MKKNDWVALKKVTEEKFESATIENCWGYQIQKDTKWNPGLNVDEIAACQRAMGLVFPNDYAKMLNTINGFDTNQISIDPEGKEAAQFARRCYKYPDDIEETKWLIEEANEYFDTVIKVLEEGGFDSKQIEGFIPLYAHRALVVFKDKTQTPVLSIWGNDIVIYGSSLMEYWCSEFHISINKKGY